MAPRRTSTRSRKNRPGKKRSGKQRSRKKRSGTRYWSHTVTTVSTFPPKGLFTKDAPTIARSLASKRVSPKGIRSGLNMLVFFINRAGRQLTRSRRAELQRAKRLMQAMLAKQRRRPT